MTAYGVSEWADFANTVVGGAAALAGLSFVGLSLRSCRDTEVSGGARRGDRCHRDCVAFGVLVAGLYQRDPVGTTTHAAR